MRNNENNSEKQLVGGSSWLTFGNIFSRILGALYIVPWTIIIGKYSIKANGLFSMGYAIYAVFLMIATAGIPTAISNLVAHYNGINEGRISLRLLKEGNRLGLLTGLISAIVLVIFAPILSAGHTGLKPVLWSLAPTVFIFPILSMYRGFFQGNQMMRESALSQVYEQVARIVYLLVGTWVTLKQDPNNWQGAVVQSTFAAFIGGIIGLIYLIFCFYKDQKFFFIQATKINKLIKHIHLKKLIIGILKQAIPFTIVASAITFYQLIDQYTFFPIMDKIGSFSGGSILNQFSRFNFNANKLIMIIVPIASSIAATSLPMLSRAFAKKDWLDIRKQIKNIYLLFFIAMFLTAFGLYGVALPLYSVFYGNTDPNLFAGVRILRISAIVAIFFGLFTVLSFIVQGLNKADLALKSLLYGIILKFIFQYPCVYFLHAEGALISTMIGFLYSCCYLFYKIRRYYKVNISDITSDVFKINLSSIFVLIISWGIVILLENFLPLRRFYQLIILLVSVIIGAFVGVALLVKFKVAPKLVKGFIPKKFNKTKK